MGEAARGAFLHGIHLGMLASVVVLLLGAMLALRYLPARAADGALGADEGWEYPAVIDLATGTIQYDHYEGRWGDPQHLAGFVQSYSVEKAKLEAQKRGHIVSEQALADGSILVQIRESF